VAHVLLFMHEYPQLLLSRAVLNPFIPQPVVIAGVALTQMQDPALGVVEPCSFCVLPVRHPAVGKAPVEVCQTGEMCPFQTYSAVDCSLVAGICSS